jgi:hypothetical protein
MLSERYTLRVLEKQYWRLPRELLFTQRGDDLGFELDRLDLSRPRPPEATMTSSGQSDMAIWRVCAIVAGKEIITICPPSYAIFQTISC